MKILLYLCIASPVMWVVLAYFFPSFVAWYALVVSGLILLGLVLAKIKPIFGPSQGGPP